MVRLSIATLGVICMLLGFWMSLLRWNEPQQWLVYSEFRYQQGVELYRVRADGEGRQRLTYNRQTERLIAPSPNAWYLAYGENGVNSHRVFTLEVRSGRETLITEGPGYIHQLEWEANGRWLRFATNDRGQRQAWRVWSRGGLPQALSQSELSPRPVLTTSPDGRWMAYTDYVTNNSVALYRAPAQHPDDPAQRLTLASELAGDTAFEWLPSANDRWRPWWVIGLGLGLLVLASLDPRILKQRMQ
jgi:Tol biopolymer transport system component